MLMVTDGLLSLHLPTVSLTEGLSYKRFVCKGHRTQINREPAKTEGKYLEPQEQPLYKSKTEWSLGWVLWTQLLEFPQSRLSPSVRYDSCFLGTGCCEA